MNRTRRCLVKEERKVVIMRKKEIRMTKKRKGGCGSEEEKINPDQVGYAQKGIVINEGGNASSSESSGEQLQRRRRGNSGAMVVVEPNARRDTGRDTTPVDSRPRTDADPSNVAPSGEVPSGEVPSDEVPSGSSGGKRRGDARAISPSGSSTGKKKLYLVGETLVGQDGLPGFFRPQMRNHLDGFYPRWADVPITTKNAVWETFQKEWNLDGHDVSDVYSKFMKQCGVQFRKFLSELKGKQMTLHKYKDVAELLNKPKPLFMKTDDTWHQYIRHWNSPEQRAKSLINARNRATHEGSSHGYGRKSAAKRLHEMAEQGKKSSMLSVMIDVNQRRDKKNNKIDEVHNKELQKAINEYTERYATSHGSEKDPLEDDLDINMWRTTSEVSRRSRHGRVMGVGSTTSTSSWKSPEASSSSGTQYEILSRVEELMKKHEEDLKRHEEELRWKDEERARDMQRVESQLAHVLEAMTKLVPNFNFPMFDPPTAGASSHASHGSGVCPEVVPQTQGVPRTQPDDEEEQAGSEEE